MQAIIDSTKKCKRCKHMKVTHMHYRGGTECVQADCKCKHFIETKWEKFLSVLHLA